MPTAPGSSNIPKGADIRRPAKGWADSKELAQIWRLLRNIRSGDSSKLAVSYGAAGITITPIETRAKKAKRAGQGRRQPSAFAAKITSKVSGNKYLADIYEDGAFDDAGTPVAATKTSEDVFILQIDTSATIPTGTFLLAIEVGDHYEGQVPIWL